MTTEIQKILADYKSKRRSGDEVSEVKKQDNSEVQEASYSQIPDILFDKILVDLKLSRIEILTLLYLYRRVWCFPNLYKDYGISQLLSMTVMAHELGVEIGDVYHALRKLEEYGHIETVRAGQFFVRKYFTKEWDTKFRQVYEDFGP